MVRNNSINIIIHAYTEVKKMYEKHLVDLEERQNKNVTKMVNELQEKHCATLMEERRNFEVKLKQKMNEQECLVKTQQLLSIKWEGERKILTERNEMLNAKLEKLTKEKVQVIDLKSQYEMSRKQKSEVEKIEEKLNKKIAAVEKQYKQEVEKIKKSNSSNMDEDIQFILEKKQYKTNKVKKQCNEELEKLETAIVRAKEEVQVIDLKSQYELSQKQRSEVDKIEKKLKIKILEVEKWYKKKVENIQKKMKSDMKETLRFALEEKQHKINDAKRECNKELGKLEMTIVRNMQKQQQKKQK